MLGRIDRDRFGADHRCRCADRLTQRRRDSHGGGLAGYTDALAIALEFEFGEAGLVKQLRQVADQVVINRGFLARRVGFFRVARHGQPFRLALISAASPLIASA